MPETLRSPKPSRSGRDLHIVLRLSAATGGADVPFCSSYHSPPGVAALLNRRDDRGSLAAFSTGYDRLQADGGRDHGVVETKPGVAAARVEDTPAGRRA